MLEFLTGTGLAVAAGLNAYIPLLMLGIGDRFLGIVQLPTAWEWLANDWVLVILGALLVVEVVADKIPIVDSFNDWIQTVIRPAAGGIVFGSGAASETVRVSDPEGFFASGEWLPIALGAAMALVVHAGKMITRPAINAASVGTAAPLASTVEDVASIAMSVFAILLPVLVIVTVAAGVVFLTLIMRRLRRRKNAPQSTARDGGSANAKAAGP
ncbi:DUF4126 domain-containing protein [Diaminobutyricimonas sp. LJ205]|uniref:DUF4126 domain-containing protein n=1 Tax=Diaminobutyricimonas sp. LJ205 TaxID=2683590 RepID=UPI0012F4CEE9|nr:DUF4126 domain-containing protein [Diaminobutyricimonas sp. LJ205]